MIKQSNAQIFLADSRLQADTPGTRNWYTLSAQETIISKSFGDLHLFNEHWLAPGHEIVLHVSAAETLLLLPVSGAIDYADLFNNNTLVAAGQSLIIHSNMANTICVKNPFVDAVISFLQLRLTAKTAPVFNVQTYDDVNEAINQLIAVAAPQHNNHFLLAKFNGRAETVYTATKNGNGVFLFVLTGAFEVEGRLLHAGDALALFESNTVEMEALSNDAIILLIETPLRSVE